MNKNEQSKGSKALSDAIDRLRAKIESGEPSADIPKECPYANFDGFGNLISVEMVRGMAYSCARPCPWCAKRPTDPVKARSLFGDTNHGAWRGNAIEDKA